MLAMKRVGGMWKERWWARTRARTVRVAMGGERRGKRRDRRVSSVSGGGGIVVVCEWRGGGVEVMGGEG